VDGIRNAIRLFGFNPRMCEYATDPEELEELIGDTKRAAEEMQTIDQLFDYFKRENPPDQRAAHRIFDVAVAVGVVPLYARAFLRPRSVWVMDLILEALGKKEKYKQRAFHDLIASKPIASGFFGRFWEGRVHAFFQERQGKSITLNLKELGKSNDIEWTLTIQNSYEFSNAGLSLKLEPIVASKKTSYLQPLSETYPTIDSIIHTPAPFVSGVGSLVLLQMATNEHSLKVKGFKSLQSHLPRSSSVKDLRPSEKNPWAVVFVVPKDRVENFVKTQTLVGDPNDIRIWQSKTRQFVLGLSHDQVYGL
jgi:hypothetical protein